MSHTLLIRIEAPLQSWGTKSQFDQRDTELEPSKSGVIGLLCAAMGIDRQETQPVLELAKLRMGVRVDQEGILQRDYHTAKDIIGSDGKKVHTTAVTNRYYLSDAKFLVGLEGETNILKSAHSALLNPHWPLFLGRKAFVPSKPLYLKDGLKDTSLEQALRHYPYLTKDNKIPRRLVLESTQASGALRMDQPISCFADRKFGARFIQNLSFEENNVPL